MLRMLTQLIRLGTLLAILISCDSDNLTPYGVVDRCTIDTEYNLCLCGKYDFNYPKRVSDLEEFTIDECLELDTTFHLFKTSEWSSKIVPPRKVRKYLEDSTSQKDLKKRVKTLRR